MMSVNTSTISFSGVPRVNLMPRAETERREKSALLRRWGWGLVAALLVVVVATGATFALQWSAEQILAAENARTNDLLTELASLSDVRAAVALESELSDFRVDAMAADLDWPAAVAQVEAVLPDGVAIAGFDLSAGPVPADEDPTTQTGLVGTFSLASSTVQEIVPLIRSVRGLEGVLLADGTEVTSEGEAEARSYTYTLRVAFDQTIYTGEYAPEEDAE